VRLIFRKSYQKPAGIHLCNPRIAHSPPNSLHPSALATPIATKPSQHLPDHLPPTFFARPAEQVAPELIGCLVVKRQEGGEFLWGVIVETEAYSQEEPAYLLW